MRASSRSLARPTPSQTRSARPGTSRASKRTTTAPEPERLEDVGHERGEVPLRPPGLDQRRQLMALEAHERRIGEHSYRVTQLRLNDALRLLPIVLRVAGPTLAAVLDGRKTPGGTPRAGGA